MKILWSPFGYITYKMKSIIILLSLILLFTYFWTRIAIPEVKTEVKTEVISESQRVARMIDNSLNNFVEDAKDIYDDIYHDIYKIGKSIKRKINI